MRDDRPMSRRDWVAGIIAFTAVVTWLITAYVTVSMISQGPDVVIWLAVSIALTVAVLRVLGATWAETCEYLLHPIRSAKRLRGVGGGPE
jgi:hypothetical protein